MGNGCAKFGVTMCSVLISISPSPQKDRSRKLHLCLFIGLREQGQWVYVFDIFTPIRGWQYIPRQMKPVTKKQSQVWILSLYPVRSSFHGGRGGSIGKPGLWRQTAHFSWDSFRYSRNIHFLPAGHIPPNYSLSHRSAGTLLHSFWGWQNSWLKLSNPTEVRLSHGQS